VGPYTDSMRKLDNKNAKNIVSPSSGTHVVLPNYYSPRTMGLLDAQSSDGRVIFFLPWLNHTIVGTTDSPCQVSDLPQPREAEIKWILGEIDKYLSRDVQVRRSDVLSAWNGIRPLVSNPAAVKTEAISREHVIHTNKESGLITVAGGKWTTYREMAEDTIDVLVKNLNIKAGPCITSNTKLIGAHTWNNNHFVKLIQNYNVESIVARHLSHTYGDQAEDVLLGNAPTGKRWPKYGIPIVDGYPYLEVEVSYAIQKEYARSVVDIIARRTRLAYLNKAAAGDAVPKIIQLMRHELNWDDARCERERQLAETFLATFAGQEEYHPEQIANK